MTPWRGARDRMVQHQLEGRGIDSERILDAMRVLPRHLFVPKTLRGEAYEDRPLPIGSGQTISQPYMTAFMTQALSLEGCEKILEVGTGSGYQTALLGMLAGEVFSAEIEPSLARRAERRLRRLKLGNARVLLGDGLEGWLEHAPFDRILLTAAVEEVPLDLAGQLTKEGWLIAPVGRPGTQNLCRMERAAGGGWRSSELMPVVFVQAHHSPTGGAA